MRQQAELLNVGIYESFVPEKTIKIDDLLSELSLEDRYFGILVNGKKATPDTKVSSKDEVIILPHIAGGES